MNQDEQSELLPCPKCRFEFDPAASPKEACYHTAGDTEFVVLCPRCKHAGPLKARPEWAVQAWNEEALSRPSLSTPSEAFQGRVDAWLLACFGEVIARDPIERNHRFLEEALELVQAGGCSASEAHQLVDYTFARPVGEMGQEVGGVMNTLAALCLAHNIDMMAEGNREMDRVSTPETMAKIRAKQAAKPKHSPLPQSSTPSEGVIERLRELLAKATPLPWAYRPQEYDDWGFIRTLAPDQSEIGLQPIVAVSKGGRIGETDFDAHRAAKTDPYEPNGRLIAEAINALPDLLARLSPLPLVEENQ